jgi:hypothetical protein
MTMILRLLVSVVASGTDPIAVVVAVISAFLAPSRKSCLGIGLLGGCLIATISAGLDYSSHHYAGVVMSREVSPDFWMHVSGVLVAVWIEAMVFREVIGLFRRPSRQTAES